METIKSLEHDPIGEGLLRILFRILRRSQESLVCKLLEFETPFAKTFSMGSKFTKTNLCSDIDLNS